MRALMLAAPIVLGTLVLSCGGAASRPTEPTPTASPEVAQGVAPSSSNPTSPASLVIEPAAPAGVPIPRGIRVIEVEGGGSGASHFWRATFAADPGDTDLLDRVAKARAAGTPTTLAAAALDRYREDVDAAGHETTGFAFMPGFDYTVPSEPVALAVFVRVPSEDPHGGRTDEDAAKTDEHGPYFEIVVGPAGG